MAACASARPPCRRIQDHSPRDRDCKAMTFAERADASRRQRLRANFGSGCREISATADDAWRQMGFLEHDPEKWTPVFRKDHAQTES